MTDEQTALDLQAAELARREIASPTLSATKEILAVHTPVLADGQPLIARADLTREKGAFYFYFRLEHEPYYLVLAVGPDDQKKLAVTSACIEAAVRVFLLVKSEKHTPDEITQRLGLTPTAAYAKGDRLHPELPPLPYTKWRLEPHKSLPEDLGRKLDLLLDQLEPASPSSPPTATSPSTSATRGTRNGSAAGTPQKKPSSASPPSAPASTSTSTPPAPTCPDPTSPKN